MDKESVHLSSPRLIDNEEVEYNLSKSPVTNEASLLCPICNTEKMAKMTFFYTNHILDYCAKCGGFFFENEEYDEFDKYSIDEGIFKDYINGHLVRIDTIHDRYIWVGKRNVSQDNNVFYLKFSVYYQTPLNCSLVMFPETPLDNFLNFLGISRKQDIRTGFHEFDKKFIIQGKNTKKINELFSNHTLRTELVEFLQNPPKVYSKKGTFKVLDKYISYIEGPYSITEETPLGYNTKNDPSGIVSRMVKIAAIIDKQHENKVAHDYHN